MSNVKLIWGIAAEVTETNHIASTVIFKEVTIHEYNPSVVAGDMTVLSAQETLKASVLTRFVDYLPLSITGEPQYFLIEDHYGETRLQSISNAQEAYDRVVENFEKLNVLIDEKQSIREISKSIQSDIRFLNGNAFRYPFIPVSLTQEDIESSVMVIESAYKELVKANTDLMKAERSFRDISDEMRQAMVSQSETEREGLQKLFLEHTELNGDAPLFVLVEALVDNIHGDAIGLNQRVVMNEVRIYNYDLNTPFDKAVLIDELVHINSFVDEDYAESLTVGERFLRPARVVTYQRGTDSSIDFGVRLLKFAPVDNWLKSYSDDLTALEEHLATEGLVNSGKLAKKCRDMSKRLANELLLDPRVCLESDVRDAIQKLDRRLDITQETTTQLQAKGAEESRRWHESRWLHSLTLEATIHLASEQK